MAQLVLPFLMLPILAAAPSSPAADFYVAANGDDAWSGRRPAPNAAGTDGPFATLARARDAVRKLKARKRVGAITVLVRAGTYYLRKPLLLTPDDSGSAACPIMYAAYPGEEAVLSGGRPITGWRRGPGKLWVADLPEGDWNFRQLFVGGERQILARTPNLDPNDPLQGRWAFVAPPPGAPDGSNLCLACIHTPGDTFEWKFTAPAAGRYSFWMYYGAKNKPFGRTNMAGRTSIQIDGGKKILLDNLPDTGSWSWFTWKKTAVVSLTRGDHVLRWTNEKGGGLNWRLWALCDDPQWTPKGARPAAPRPGKRLVLKSAAKFDSAKAKEYRVTGVRPRAYRNRFHFRQGDIRKWPKSPNPEIHIFPAWGWVNAILSLDRVDLAQRLAYVKNANCTQELRLGNRYFVANVLEALDSPGEWFFDQAARRLYYWPRDADFQRQGVVAPVLDRLVDLRGDIDGEDEGALKRRSGPPAKSARKRRFVEYVAFRGFTFRHTTYKLEMRSVYSPDDAAVWLRRARHCTIEGCRFLGVGGYAVRLSLYSSDNKILGDTILDAGQGGVLLIGYDTRSQPKRNVIAGNRIERCGRIWKHVAGVYVTTGGENRIAYNDVIDCPRYGISLKSFRKGSASHHNVVEYNRLVRTNLETNDTGAIETLGRDRERSGNIIRYNILLDSVGVKTTPAGRFLSPYYTWGIYLDDYSSGVRCYGNLIARTYRGGFHVHLGFDNVFENNIVVDGAQQQFECNGRKEMRNNVVRRNIFYFHKGDIMRVRRWNEKVLAECDYNVYWKPGADLAKAKGKLTPKGSWAQWRAAGFDAHSLVADPRFVDPARDDYRLRPDSPALQLGFKPIPFDQIGVRGYRREAF